MEAVVKTGEWVMQPLKKEKQASVELVLNTFLSFIQLTRSRVKAARRAGFPSAAAVSGQGVFKAPKQLVTSERRSSNNTTLTS